jgi:purine-binding chemotaxis protein CheW
VTTSTTDALYGVFRAGEVRVALPLDELREVIMRPPRFSPLPASADGLLGAVNLRHVVIPVLDLSRLAGFGAHAEDGGKVIVIVARAGQIFGLVADEIEGVARVTADALLETTVAGEGRALFSHTFERVEDRAVVALLDAAAISDRPGIPVVKDVGLRPPVGAAADSGRRTVLLLRCGAVGLSIDVSHVHSVIPQLTLHSSPLDGSTCRGVVHLHGRAVPAVDPLGLLGLGALPDDGNLRGLVLATERGLVVLTVSDIADIVAVPLSDVLPLPPIGMRKGGFLDGILRVESGEQHLLLNGSALRADPELDTLAGLGLPLDAAASAESRTPEVPGAVPAESQDGRRIVASVRKFLTYSVGMEAATPLDQITEIVPYPEHAIGLDSGGALLGVFTHRKLSVPLLSLPVLLGLADPVDPAAARVLLVDATAQQPAPEAQLIGFVVPALHAIEDSVWEESAPKEPGEPGAMLQRGPLVKIGTETQGRLLPNVDLTQLVAAELVS